MPLDIHSVNIDLTVLFGSVHIFCARNRAPSPSDFDFTNLDAGHSDFLSIVSVGSCAECGLLHLSIVGFCFERMF
jgi:hypothetical protein